MVNFSIAVAVLLASPTPIDAFELPQRRRHHNIIVHHSSRGDYNNYRDERERGGAPRGEYGFDQWDDDPINREKNGYDGYDWQFQRENDNGDINDMKCVNTVHLLYHDDQVIMSCVLIRSVLLFFFFISFALVTDKIPIPRREMNSADLSNINKTINHLVMTGEITD